MLHKQKVNTDKMKTLTTSSATLENIASPEQYSSSILKVSHMQSTLFSIGFHDENKQWNNCYDNKDFV